MVTGDATIDSRTSEAGLTDTAEAGLRDYFALLKPRVMSLVVFTGFVGMYLAPGRLHPVLGAAAILCIAVGAGAAGAINMWYDRDIDAVMERTKRRPLPSGRIEPSDALAMGILLALLAVALLGLATNWVAGGLLAGAILFYVVVYTIMLKRRTPQNIVIGGAAGAFPPLIGWAAVTGDITIAPLVLFAVILFWTPPHFWALALYRNDDYARAQVPMLPVVAGRATTKRQMFGYSVLLLPLVVVPFAIGLAGPVYLAVAVVMGGLLVVSAWRVLREPDEARDRAARQMFGFSILYLFMVFAMLILDAGGRLA